jgi:hypothetical protein
MFVLFKFVLIVFVNIDILTRKILHLLLRLFVVFYVLYHQENARTRKRTPTSSLRADTQGWTLPADLTVTLGEGSTDRSNNTCLHNYSRSRQARAGAGELHSTSERQGGQSSPTIVTSTQPPGF